MASPVPARRDLGLQVDLIYRNANVRIAVSERLLNDLMPTRKMEYQKSRTRCSTIRAGRERHREPRGGADAARPEAVGAGAGDQRRDRRDHHAGAGPAQFYNDSQSDYVARKPMEIDMKGIRLLPVEVEVNNETQLRGVNTKLDIFPIIR